MVHLLKSVITAVLALSSLTNGMTIDVREKRRAIAPVAEPVVVDRFGANMRVIAYDGGLLAGYTTIESGRSFVRISKSKDKGKSWTRHGVVLERETIMSNLKDVYPLKVNNQGRLIVAFRNHDKDGKNNHTNYRITVYESTDGGAKWKFLSHVEQRKANGKNGLWEPFLRLSKDGSIQIYYTAENYAEDQNNVMRRSTDGGKTWSKIIPVSGSAIKARDGMSSVTQLENGGLMVAFESQLSGHMGIYTMTSKDDGMTWGNRRKVYTATDNNEAGAPQIANVGGTIIINFMTNEAHPELPSIHKGQQKCIFSTDNGSGWSGATVLSGLGSWWPALYPLDDDNFLSLYSMGSEGPLYSRQYKLSR